jgi:hypothetical protein
MFKTNFFLKDTLKKETGFISIVQDLQKNSFKSIAIFVDNSGFDVVLGVVPFVIELLKNGTKVMFFVFFVENLIL